MLPVNWYEPIDGAAKDSTAEIMYHLMQYQIQGTSHLVSNIWQKSFSSSRSYEFRKHFKIKFQIKVKRTFANLRKTTCHGVAPL